MALNDHLLGRTLIIYSKGSSFAGPGSASGPSDHMVSRRMAKGPKAPYTGVKYGTGLRPVPYNYARPSTSLLLFILLGYRGYWAFGPVAGMAKGPSAP